MANYKFHYRSIFTPNLFALIELGCHPACDIDHCGGADKEKLCSATGYVYHN